MTAWIEVIGWTLTHFVWEGALIGLAAAGVLRLLRHASARARYLAACASLLAALAAPLITLAELVAPNGMWLAAGATSAPLVGSAAAGGQAAEVGTPWLSVAWSPAPLAFGDERLAGWLAALVACWAIGVLALTARLAAGWWQVRRLHREARSSAPSDWATAAARIGHALALPRPVHVVDSLRVETPTVIGWLRPVVLLPVAALANLTPAQVHAILAHELAHIRRHDFAVNVLQSLAETILFYHPAVWWISAQIRVEREHCCDDVAVAICGDAVGYAEALTTIAARTQSRRAGSLSPAPLAMAATSGSLLLRVRRLLQPDQPSRRPAMPLVLATTLILVLLVCTRLAVVAQTTPAVATAPSPTGAAARRLGPMDLNRLIGFELFPGPARYVTDDPRGARAWDVHVAYPGGAMSFIGFTGRGLVRYAYGLNRQVVLDGPAWLDGQSMTIRAATNAATPGDEDFRAALRSVLDDRVGLSLEPAVRRFPVYGLQAIDRDRLGPNIRPSTADCRDAPIDRNDTTGPTLRARGQQARRCGVDQTIWGARGVRATMGDLARSLRGFTMDPVPAGDAAREIVDQTGLTGVYDFDIRLGLLPLALIASAHPALAAGFGPVVRTFPQALEAQLGLRLVPSEASYDVVVITGKEQ